MRFQILHLRSAATKRLSDPIRWRQAGQEWRIRGAPDLELRCVPDQVAALFLYTNQISHSKTDLWNMVSHWDVIQFHLF